MRIRLLPLMLLLPLIGASQSTPNEITGSGTGSSARKGFKTQHVEVSKEWNFDIGKIGGLGRPETAEKFAKIWDLFRKNYAFNTDGAFAESVGANTPNTPVTQNEFLYFVTENNPTVVLSSTEKCARCSGTGRRTALFNGNGQGEESQIASVKCIDCQGLGKISLTESIKLSFSGKLPARASKEERQALAVKPIPAGAITIVDKKITIKDTPIQPNDERILILNEIKAKASNGDLDAEYKYAKYFEYGKFPIKSDRKVFEKMLNSLAEKGYSNAFLELASIFRNRALSPDSGSRKMDPDTIAEYIKWKSLYGGEIETRFEVSEATQAEGQRRADEFRAAHPKPVQITPAEAK